MSDKKYMLASDIDISKLNVAMKGVRVQVRPLYDLFNEGKQTGFALNVKLAGENKFSRTKYAPFLFENEVEAEKAAGIINTWSVSP